MIINHAPNSQNPTGGPEEGDGASAEAAPGRPAQLPVHLWFKWGPVCPAPPSPWPQPTDEVMNRCTVHYIDIGICELTNPVFLI